MVCTRLASAAPLPVETICVQSLFVKTLVLPPPAMPVRSSFSLSSLTCHPRCSQPSYVNLAIFWNSTAADQVDYVTLGLHIPQRFEHSGNCTAKVNYSARSLVAFTNLSIQMSFSSPSHSTPTNSQPPVSLEQIRSSTSNMSKPDYCKGHLSRDVPFAAFRLGGSKSPGGPDVPAATIVSRTTDVDSAIQTISRSFAAARSVSSLAPGGTGHFDTRSSE